MSAVNGRTTIIRGSQAITGQSLWTFDSTCCCVGQFLVLHQQSSENRKERGRQKQCTSARNDPRTGNSLFSSSVCGGGGLRNFRSLSAAAIITEHVRSGFCKFMTQRCSAGRKSEIKEQTWRSRADCCPTGSSSATNFEDDFHIRPNERTTPVVYPPDVAKV